MIPYVCLGIFGENGTLDKYIVFKGDSEIEDKTLFSELEWLSIQDGKQTVISSKQQIFPDDTIHTIKQKILYVLQNEDAGREVRESEEDVGDEVVQGGAGEINMSTISYEELYLFYESYQKKTAYSMYEIVLDSLNRMNRKGFKKRVGMSDNEKNQFLINRGFPWRFQMQRLVRILVWALVLAWKNWKPKWMSHGPMRNGNHIGHITIFIAR